MDALFAVLAITVAIGLLFELARRLQVPYPSLFVLGGLALGFVPGMPRIHLEPELVLLVFLPPLLFEAAVATPVRDLKTDVWPIARLAILLVLFTMAAVAVVGHFVIGLDWAAALVLGAILGPTDAIAATSIFRRIVIPRRMAAIVEGESLFNDATALVAYRTFLLAATGAASFVLVDALANFASAVVGGVAIGVAVGLAGAILIRWLDDPPVEVLVSLVIPFAAYLPADELGLSGVLAAVAAGLIVGSRLSTILTPTSRTLWVSTWKMVGFLLNGFAFVLVGLELPEVLGELGDRSVGEVVALVVLVSLAVIVTRFVYLEVVSRLSNGPRRQIARVSPRLASRLVVVVSWSGMRGAVSLAAALALPLDFPERNLVLLLTFAVIVVTLVGQGLTLPWLVRWALVDNVDLDGDEHTLARGAAYRAGIEAIVRAREKWPGHLELMDRLEASLLDRTEHLATDDPDETAERAREREEHEAIQRSIIAAQRAAVIDLRDRRLINDRTLRIVERDLDLEELRMEG